MKNKTQKIMIMFLLIFLFIFNINNLFLADETNTITIDSIQNDIFTVFSNIENYNIIEIEPVTMYANTNVNIRSGPGTEYSIVGSLKINQDILCVGICDDKWYQVKYSENKYYVSKKYLSPEIITIEDNQEKKELKTIPSPGIAEPLGNVSSKMLSDINAQLSLIPQNALDNFVNNGWHIYLTDENIAQTMFDGQYKSVQGGTLYLEKIIKIENRNKAIKNATLHEFGHFVYYTCGYFNYDKYQQILNAFNQDVGNAKLMNITYGLNSPEEFYAEVFFKYITNPEKTSNCFPNITEMIKNDLNSL